MLSLGMKDARLRLRGDKENPQGLCLSCGKKATSRELTSCSDPKCVKECQQVFRWVRGIMRKLDSRGVLTSYVNFQNGQGGA